jgi:hypothetical protein
MEAFFLKQEDHRLNELGLVGGIQQFWSHNGVEYFFIVIIGSAIRSKPNRNLRICYRADNKIQEWVFSLVKSCNFAV